MTDTPSAPNVISRFWKLARKGWKLRLEVNPNEHSDLRWFASAYRGVGCGRFGRSPSQVVRGVMEFVDEWKER